jgi:hypothetical protein
VLTVTCAVPVVAFMENSLHRIDRRARGRAAASPEVAARRPNPYLDFLSVKMRYLTKMD